MKKTIKKPVGTVKKTASKKIEPVMPIIANKNVSSESCGAECHCGHNHGFGRWLLGLVLVLVGLLYLAKNTGLLPMNIDFGWNEIWPVLVVIIGLSMINRRSKLSIFFGIIIAVVALLFTLFVISFNFGQKTYDNQVNQAIKETQDKAKAVKNQPINSEPVVNVGDSIKVSNIQPNEKVANPIKIVGQAKGTWFFEGSFPIKLISETGEELASTTAKAQGDWMTDTMVDFKASLKYSKTTSTKAILIFEKDNPSGLPQNEAAFALPVDLK